MANNYKSKKKLANTTFKVHVLVTNIHIIPSKAKKDIEQENEYLTLDVPNKYKDFDDADLYDYLEERVYNILTNKFKTEVIRCQIFIQDDEDIMNDDVYNMTVDEAYDAYETSNYMNFRRIS